MSLPELPSQRPPTPSTAPERAPVTRRAGGLRTAATAGTLAAVGVFTGLAWTADRPGEAATPAPVASDARTDLSDDDFFQRDGGGLVPAPMQSFPGSGGGAATMSGGS